MVLDFGKVISVKDGVVRSSGLKKVSAGEMVKIGNVFGMVLNLETDIVAIVIFGQDNTVKEGDRVERSKSLMSITIGKEILRQSINRKNGPNNPKIYSIHYKNMNLIHQTNPLLNINKGFRLNQNENYTFIQKRTMWTTAKRIVSKITDMPNSSTVSMPSGQYTRGFASYICHPNTNEITKDTQKEEQGLLSPEKQENLKTAKELIGKSKGHPFNGVEHKNTLSLKGYATHSPKGPKQEGYLKYKPIIDESGKEPLYNAPFDGNAKSVDVDPAYFVKGKQTGTDGSIVESRLEEID